MLKVFTLFGSENFFFNFITNTLPNRSLGSEDLHISLFRHSILYFVRYSNLFLKKNNFFFIFIMKCTYEYYFHVLYIIIYELLN